MRKRRFRWGFSLILFLLFAVLLVTIVILYVRPERTLDMNYSEIVWKDKLTQMLETRKPELELSEAEFNSLAKAKLVKELQRYELPISVTGADFQLDGDMLLVHMSGSWGRAEFGAAVHYRMEYSAGQLELTPEAVRVRQVSISPQLLGLERLEIHLESYMPDIVAVKEIAFHDRSMTLRLTFDWLEIASYLTSY
ncbi:hypothetical protein [Paenibacillus fonticola]|uniref:hypothetical protein n=1 Tax=Paenibacillus fonticola TaxID=379896 RepID=UPI000360A175|nr:hypothetical protein [Paenibacillus fonticola]